MAAFLEVLDLHKNYGSTAALCGVHFAVAEGELFGLLGPNGAGKTTLLSILSCLMEPTRGEARLLGRTLNTRDRELRRLLGVVPQDLALYGELSAAENLRFFGELYGLNTTDVRRRTDEVLAAIGLTDRAGDRVATFSGGMKRRLNLGVALMHRPRLLLLDEPTTGVDPQSRNHLFEEIRRIHREGVTVVYTSHYMEEVQALCSRIGIMDHGRVVACNTLPGLLRTLKGTIRLHLTAPSPALAERLRQLPDVDIPDPNGCRLEIVSADTKRTLLQVAALLHELGVEATGLEAEEPNLERVFLHLTGRALRD